MEGRGFTAIPNAVLRDRSLTITSRVLFGVILSYSWAPDQPCTVPAPELCEDCAIGRSAFFDALKQLRERGLIEVRKERVGNGWRNVYVPLVRGVVFTARDEVVRDPDNPLGSSEIRTGGSSGRPDGPRARARNDEEDEALFSATATNRDALKRRITIGRREVPAAILERAEAVHAHYCALTGRRLRALKADGTPSEDLRRIAARLVEEPDRTLEELKLIVERSVANPPGFVEGVPNLGHIFGPRAWTHAVVNEGVRVAATGNGKLIQKLMASRGAQGTEYPGAVPGSAEEE